MYELLYMQFQKGGKPTEKKGIIKLQLHPRHKCTDLLHFLNENEFISATRWLNLYFQTPPTRQTGKKKTTEK